MQRIGRVLTRPFFLPPPCRSKEAILVIFNSLPIFISKTLLKIFSKIFPKPIDKFGNVWYNKEKNEVCIL